MAGTKKEMKPTSFETLKKYSNGVVIELSPFSETQPFVCRLKRPELLDVIESGIPNELLGVAYKLFNPEDEKNENKSAEEEFKTSSDFRKVLECIAEATMVEPTYKEVLDAGMKLSTIQLMEIYDYVNTGVEKLKFFREQQED